MNDETEIEQLPLLGEKLRDARVAKGLSIEEISTELHILPSNLRAIEEDKFDNIPHGHTFAKGYMRTYANRLGIDPEPLIESFNERFAPKKKRAIQILPNKKLRPMVVGDKPKYGLQWIKKALLLVVVLIVLGAVYMGLTKLDFSNESVSQPDATSMAPLHLSAETPVPDLADEATIQAEADRQAQELPQQRVTDEEVEVVEPVVEDVVLKDRLLFELTDDSWIEVRDANGDKIFADLARDGKTFELEGDAPFTVILGNGKAVAVSLNGKQIKFNYGRNNYAEFTAE